MDLFRAGVIADPLFGMNHKDLHWIIQSDFTYQTTFDVPDEIWSSDEILLGLEGVDTFAEIYLNGEHIGTTDNMFFKYEYDIKDLVKSEGNLLEVQMLSTKRKMDEIDTGDYFGIFNVPRVLVRKAQCHFGWDWAPDMPGYGIYKPVWIQGVSRERIQDVSYRAYNDGNVSLSVELNYDLIPLRDYYGKVIETIPEEFQNDTLIYRVTTKPDADLDSRFVEVYEQKAGSRRNFANFQIENPHLWWPAGYGEQPMYRYRVELMRDGKVLDAKEGKFAFREVRLEEKPIARGKLECKFVVNEVSIFAKGSNWVPAECFLGEMKEDKYRKLLTLAREGNWNMLRVWGGGIYEDDVFYEICDELGIMVWQDMMFSCADIPEERQDFMENVRKEIDYQIRRLRSHPSIVIWSGCNEKVGAICKQKSHGDYFLDVILRGQILSLDASRPYVKQSPHGMTEMENGPESGDAHTSSFERALHEGIEHYRRFVGEQTPSFVSECAVMGPGTAESYRKIFPADKVWPMNEYWDDRLTDNPYAEVLMTFAERQRKYASTLYGESETLENFICKGMTAHAEALRAEAEHARANKGLTWGFMNWMYSDTWPSGNLSVVSYDCEPNQSYYQLKRSFAPVLATFVQKKDERLMLSIVNDTIEQICGKITYGMKTMRGKIVWNRDVTVEVPANQMIELVISEESRTPNCYLYVKGMLSEREVSSVYSHQMWKGCELESDYQYSTEDTDDGLLVTIQANQFAKGVTLRLPDNEKYQYSDNYFDMEAGEEKTILIRGTMRGDADALVVTDFAKETKGKEQNGIL